MPARDDTLSTDPADIDVVAEVEQLRTQYAAATSAGLTAKATLIRSELLGRVATSYLGAPKRMRGTRVNVKDFKAAGDGTTDDTQSIADAIAAVQTSRGGEVYFPPGKYLVAGNISLGNVALVGPGVMDGETPYTDNGAQLWQTNTSNPMFTIDGSDVAVRGLQFYYPSQDGSGATPTTYAPTFRWSTTLGIVNVAFTDCQWTNAFDCLEIYGTVGGIRHGRVIVDNCRACALSRFIKAKYVADVIQVSNFNISPGIWQDIAIVGNAYPAKYMSANAKAFYMDVQCDGLYLSNGVVFGYLDGVYCDTGLIDWLNVRGVLFDQVQYGVRANTAAIADAVIEANQFWATNSYDAAQLCYALYVGGTSGNGDILFNGNMCSKSQGEFVYVAGDAFKSLTVSHNRFKDWAQATGLASNQYAIEIVGATSGTVIVNGNTFANSSGVYGCGLSLTCARGVVTNNVFRANVLPVNLPGAGTYNVNGNQATGTTGASGCMTGTSWTKLTHFGNQWDILTVGHVDSVTATLDFPNLAAGTSSTLDVTFPGLRAGDVVVIGLPNAGAHASSGILFRAWCQANDSARVQATNWTAGAVDPASFTITLAVLPRS